MEDIVVIVGAGPSGIATSACLSQLSITNLILEKEECSGSLWKKRTYDGLNLHLAKEYCSLPYMPHPSTSPTFISNNDFVNYLDDYISHFDINPRFCCAVISASYDEDDSKWRIEAKNTITGAVEVYVAKFLVVATGENGEGFIPKLPGLDSFTGEIVHTCNYKSGRMYRDKKVLVVGCGNSGMEIAYGLSNPTLEPTLQLLFEARALVLVLQFHVLSKEMVRRGMVLLKYLPVSLVDSLINFLALVEYGNLAKYGIRRPSKGPFYLKATTGRSPVIDVGTVKRIKAGEIEVLPTILCIEENNVSFEDGLERDFDVIVFATGYQSLALDWLKDYSYVLNKTGMPKNKFPTHFKGQKGVYCAGLSRRGLFGVSMDAKAIAEDIQRILGATQ